MRIRVKIAIENYVLIIKNLISADDGSNCDVFGGSHSVPFGILCQEGNRHLPKYNRIMLQFFSTPFKNNSFRFVIRLFYLHSFMS